MTHMVDEIPRLLSGDATRKETFAAAAHLRGCPDCQQELVSAVAAHASLRSAHRFAPEVILSDPEEADDVAPAELPDMSAVFARVRADVAGASKRHRNRRRLLAVAAAVVVAGGAGLTIAETVGSSSSSPSAARTVSLRAFGVGTEPATMQVAANGRMHIDATKLPPLDAQHAYEVWLTDPGRTRMVQVGFIGPDRRADLTVSPAVLGHYGDVEVSRQPADQTVKYSGVSLLRGSYR